MTSERQNLTASQLKAWLRTRKLTYGWLADKLGVTEATIQHWLGSSHLVPLCRNVQLFNLMQQYDSMLFNTLKPKNEFKPGDKFLVVAEYDAEGFIRVGNASITGFSQSTCYEYPKIRNEPYRPFVPGDIVYVDSWEGHPAYDVVDADAPLYCWKKVIMLERHESEDGTVGVPDEKYPDKIRWIHCSHLKLLAKAEDNNAWIVSTNTGFKIYSCEDGVEAQRAVIDCADDAGREAIEQYVIDYCKGLCDEIRAAAVNRYKAKYEA